MPFKDEATKKAYWYDNLKIVGVLLVIWAAVSYFAGIIFAEQLNAFSFFGYPLGFWFAQQGSIYTFVILIFVYTKLMGRLDRKYGVDEKDDD